LCYVAGVAIFGEPLTLSCVFGSVLVIGACVVVLAGRKQKARPVKPNLCV